MSRQEGLLGWMGRTAAFWCVVTVGLPSWCQVTFAEPADGVADEEVSAPAMEDELADQEAVKDRTLDPTSYLLADRAKYEAAKARKLAYLATLSEADIEAMAFCDDGGIEEDESLSEDEPAVPLYSGGKEGFEGAFPGPDWFVGDSASNSGEDYWDDVSCKHEAGDWSAWCAGHGDRTDCSYYDTYMSAYMYVEAEYHGWTSDGTNKMKFELWNRVEEPYDCFGVHVQGYVNEPCHGSGSPDYDYWFDWEYDTGTLFPWDTKNYSLPSGFNVW